MSIRPTARRTAAALAALAAAGAFILPAVPASQSAADSVWDVVVTTDPGSTQMDADVSVTMYDSVWD